MGNACQNIKEVLHRVVTDATHIGLLDRRHSGFGSR